MDALIICCGQRSMNTNVRVHLAIHAGRIRIFDRMILEPSLLSRVDRYI